MTKAKQDLAPARPEPYKLTDHPMHYLAAIQRQHQMNVTRALRPLGISALMWRVLALLSDLGECTISHMADVAVLDRTALGRLLETMARQGLVRRTERSPEDRRATVVTITDSGVEVYSAALPTVQRLNRELREGIGEADFATAMAVLRRMKANARSSF
jgi:DNA-binding MarR family transcriptional regulator